MSNNGKCPELKASASLETMRSYAEAAMQHGWHTAISAAVGGSLAMRWEQDWFDRNPPQSAVPEDEWRTPVGEELVEKPVAFLKFWFDDGTPRCRVDMTDICEPWLDALKPTITPLYSLEQARTAMGSALPDKLIEALEPFAAIADKMLEVNGWGDDDKITVDLSEGFRTLERLPVSIFRKAREALRSHVSDGGVS